MLESPGQGGVLRLPRQPLAKRGGSALGRCFFRVSRLALSLFVREARSRKIAMHAPAGRAKKSRTRSSAEEPFVQGSIAGHPTRCTVDMRSPLESSTTASPAKARWQDLPNTVLCLCINFYATFADIHIVARTCRTFAAAARHPLAWHLRVLRFDAIDGWNSIFQGLHEAAWQHTFRLAKEARGRPWQHGHLLALDVPIRIVPYDCQRCMWGVTCARCWVCSSRICRACKTTCPMCAADVCPECFEGHLNAHTCVNRVVDWLESFVP